MKKYFFIALLLCSVSFFAKAQDYENSVGARFGLSNGVTFKHFFTTNDAIEGILSTRYGGFNLTGLFERHTAVFDTDGMYFFYGAGAHIGSYYNDRWFDDNANHTIIGIDGILGLEYVIPDFPLNIALDWKPGFNLIGYTGFWGDELALSVRFIF